jgi:branched-chain amino acid transport system permease protein
VVGIPIDRIFSYTFGLSTILVGTSGILLAPKYFISPQGGWDILVKAFVIVAFGGLGSVKGTLYASFILGIIEALVAWRLGVTRVMFFWFSVLLFTLVIRPRGLFGTWE